MDDEASGGVVVAGQVHLARVLEVVVAADYGRDIREQRANSIDVVEQRNEHKMRLKRQSFSVFEKKTEKISRKHISHYVR